jgi:tRNA-modifying protein YgfZ
MDNAIAYHAAYNGTVYHNATDRGRIYSRDRDRAALLHRLSTNELEKLQPGQGTRTVLTTPIGRMIDLLTVYNLPDADDPRLLLVTSPNQGAQTFKHLKKNIFFNDKLTLENASPNLAQYTLYGPQASATLAALGAQGFADLPRFAIRRLEVAGIAAYVARDLPIGGEGWQLFVPAEQLASLQHALHEAGALLLDEPTYDILRVEHGYLAYGQELSLEYIPLESNLWDAISFSKGCYVGQEIIARMESRGRLAKVLRGLRFGDSVASAQSSDLEIGSLPQKLAVAGKEAGDLTSLVHSPTHGLVGLGYVRSAHAEPGTQVAILGSAAVATVVELPFQKEPAA